RSRERGPRTVVGKKGEHGAGLVADGWAVFAPGYPLETVFDPTGAGDAFAGGFLVYVARSGSLAPDELRRAMVFGSVMGSYAVEDFSVDRFRSLEASHVTRRVQEFRELTAFEANVEENRV
ncbi:MAG: sugar kinase, partial [Gemmatimonadetes bacterium]|nr:sugar kinase [Gemmatimonadota bacterium]